MDSSIPPDLIGDITPADMEELFPALPTPDDDFKECWMGAADMEPKDWDNHSKQLESKPMDDTLQTGLLAPNNRRDVGTLPSPTRFQPTMGNANAPWAKSNEKHLKEDLGVSHNKPGPRPGEKKGNSFERDLNKARSCPIKMAGVRKKHRHLFEGNCRRAMEKRLQVVLQQLLAAPDPAAAALDPLMALDIQFARQYYGIDLLAFATRPIA